MLEAIMTYGLLWSTLECISHVRLLLKQLNAKNDGSDIMAHRHDSQVPLMIVELPCVSFREALPMIPTEILPQAAVIK